MSTAKSTPSLPILAGFVFMILSAPAICGPIAPLQSDVYRARDRVLPALVHIQPVVSDYNTGKLQKQSVVGSGVVIHKEGYVVTNYHVAGRAERILCTMADKEQVSATLVGGDPLTDLAVIKLNLDEYTGKLEVASFGDSDSLQVGQFVLAMGSPLALSRSLSFGVISTVDRYFSDDVRLPSGERTGQYNTWLQTDAAINPGNSGGPLVDLGGRVVGINSRATLFANNLGFSIPSNIVREVTEQLIKYGKVERSWVGINFQPMQDLEGWFGSNIGDGALISSVDPDSPADEIGLRAGDIIEAIDGTPISARFVEEIPRINKTIADYPSGSTIVLNVRRRDENFLVKVLTKELGEIMGEDRECKEWGFTIKEITQQMSLDFNLQSREGVFVSGVRRPGPAATSGLFSGDIITMIGDTETPRLKSFFEVYSRLINEQKKPALLTVRRGSATRYALIKLPDEKSSDSKND
ncbi:MAG: trypsin-like peptidase domain-containing protein [candidate division Zixibacteria bacterium]|nr:trypsin-like peptidase domain-containing protein [candidate division Zixibacteria bacterium]